MAELFPFPDIHSHRVQALNDHERDPNAKYVLYWMQHSQRTEWNHALEYTVRAAQELDMGVVVCFGLMEDYPDGNERHFHFMLEGLLEVQKQLADRNMKFVMRFGEPPEVCLDLAKDAALVVTDRGYQRHHRNWRKKVGAATRVQCVQVESDLIVPVEIASDKQEYAARTIRKQLMGKYEDYMERPEERTPPVSTKSYSIDKLDFRSVGSVLDKMTIDRDVKPVEEFTGGTSQAKKRFKDFLDNHLDQYDDTRNQPQTEHVSHMSKFLHLGQISPCYLIDEVGAQRGKNKKSFVEELIVRRELTHNFVYYCDDYDNYNCLPDWAKETLEKHTSDKRPHVYSRSELENGETDDEYWNAAMKQMRDRGYLHNHMRMYWGKQIIKWTNTPKYAYQTTLYLNNKYFLDGRDANSFANVAWLFGIHDRGWTERDIYGKVRIMTPGGLERKTDPGEFVKKVER